MGLLPLTDLIEALLLRLCLLVPGCQPKSRKGVEEDHYMGVPREAHDLGASSSGTETASEDEDGCGCARLVAVVIVIALFLGTFTGLFLIIYHSAQHMKRDFKYYREGAKNIMDTISLYQANYKDKVPDMVMNKMTQSALSSMEEVSNWILGTLLDK